MASRLRNRLSRVFSSLQISNDETKTAPTDTEDSSAGIKNNGTALPPREAVGVGVRVIPRDSLENIRRTSVLQPETGQQQGPRVDLEMGTISNLASNTMKIISQTLRANTQFFYVESAVPESKEDSNPKVCPATAGNGNRSSTFNSLKRHSRSLRSRCSRSSMGNRQYDQKSTVELSSPHSPKTVMDLPPGIEIDIPDATLLSPNEQRWIREAHLAGRSRVSLLDRGAPWPSPAEVATRRSSNDEKANNVVEPLQRALSRAAIPDPELPVQSHHHEPTAASYGTLCREKTARPLSHSYTRNPFSLQGVSDPRSSQRKVSPYQLAMSTPESRLQLGDKADEPVECRSFQATDAEALANGSSDLFERDLSRTGSVEQKVDTQVQIGYDADDESDAEDEVPLKQLEDSSPPSMGPKAPWEQSRADRNRCYESIKYMSAETISDTEVNADLQLRRLSSGSSCYSRKTGSSSQHENTLKVDDSKLVKHGQSVTEDIEIDQGFESCSSDPQSLLSRNVLRASARVSGTGSGSKEGNNLRQKYQMENYNRSEPRTNIDSIIAADQTDDQLLCSRKSIADFPEPEHQIPVWAGPLPPPFDQGICPEVSSDNHFCSPNACNHRSPYVIQPETGIEQKSKSYAHSAATHDETEMKNMEARQQIEPFSPKKAARSRYPRGGVYFLDQDNEDGQRSPTWPVEYPEHWDGLGSICAQGPEIPCDPDLINLRNGRRSLYDELSNLPSLVTSEDPSTISSTSVSPYDISFSQEFLSTGTSQTHSPSRDEPGSPPSILHSPSAFEPPYFNNNEADANFQYPFKARTEHFQDRFRMNAEVDFMTARALSSSSLASELGVVEFPEPGACGSDIDLVPAGDCEEFVVGMQPAPKLEPVEASTR